LENLISSSFLVGVPGIGDMANLGQMAAELAKQRQKRVTEKNTANAFTSRKSVALNKLLSELDNIS